MKTQIENMLRDGAEIRNNLLLIRTGVKRFRWNYRQQNRAFQSCLDECNELKKRIKELEK